MKDLQRYGYKPRKSTLTLGCMPVEHDNCNIGLLIFKHEGYLSHTRLFFYYFNTLCIFDMIEYSSVVSCLRYTIIHFLAICCVSLRDYFKIICSRISPKAACMPIGVIGPKFWNNLHSDQQCGKSIFRFKTHYKRLLLPRYEHLD